MIYLDSAATAEYNGFDNIIVRAMMNAMQDSWMNPSSLYAVDVKNKIKMCRTNIANFIGAKPEEVYFTSGASESNNWAIRGWVDYVVEQNLYLPRIITTPIEHKSILNLVESHADYNVSYCKVDAFGEVDFKYLDDLLKAHGRGGIPFLVSIQMANNEIGTLQDVRRVSKMTHKYNGILHVDATQAFGHIPINVEELDIDMMSCSGHKLSTVLKGIGFLYKKNGINIHPLIYGNQEMGLRGGTENTFGIIGLGKAIELWGVCPENCENICEKRDYFIERLKTKFDCDLNGHSLFRLPNNINVTFPQNISGESLLYMLDMSNIKISTGSACNSKEVEPSYVLKAIGLTDEEAMRTVRFTLSEDTTYKEIDYTIEEIGKAIKILETN